jgi:HEAT repeat protein
VPPPAPNPAERRRAAALAGHTGDEDAARALLADDVPAVRATAFGALGRLERLGADDLRRAAGDAAPEVRRRAAELAAAAAPTLGPADASGVLLGLLDDPDAGVVETAAWASGELDGAPAALVGALQSLARTHDDVLCREAAVAALGSLGPPEALATILDALADKATVRRRAVIALAPYDTPEVTAALRRHLDDRDRQVREAAEDLLGR